MDAFQWDECFVTGLAMVDQQHHALVDIINRFGELLTQPDGATQAEIDHVFNELADYSQFHFREEEAMMQATGLDSRHIRPHQEEHTRFLKDVSAMHAAMSRNNTESAKHLLTFLTNWLAYHILGTDLNMARLVAAVKAGQSQQDAYLAEHSSRDPATATLLRSMTSLFNQVSERNRALLELNQTLETRIAARTRELVDMNRQLEDMAMTDVLTGLPNRRHAMRSLAQYWHQSTQSGTPLACMMIDADGFKAINDNYGHDAGDEVLLQLARCLKDSVRNDDLVCRLGGDEFLILCEHTALHGALTTAEKLRREVAALHVPAGAGVWHGSVSVGVAERAPDMAVFDDLLKQADDAVYIAKRNGRNCVATATTKKP